MATRSDHAEYLQRNDYPLEEGVQVTAAEAALLRRYGHWMEALAAGRIAPTTPEQERFLQVALGEREARTEFERAWANLERQRRQSPALFARVAEARNRAEELRQRKDAERATIMARVQADLDALDSRFAEELSQAGQELQQAEAALRAEVLLTGRSLKHGNLHAVYCRGRVTWDADGLSRLAERLPAILDCQRVGPPTVQLRYQREKE